MYLISISEEGIYIDKADKGEGGSLERVQGGCVLLWKRRRMESLRQRICDICVSVSPYEQKRQKTTKEDSWISALLSDYASSIIHQMNY